MTTIKQQYAAVGTHLRMPVDHESDLQQARWLEQLRLERRPYLDRCLDERALGSLAGGLGAARRVLVVLAAPRSGSSLLYALLTRVRGLLCTTAETTPFYRISKVTPLYEDYDGEHASRPSDRAHIEWLRAEIACDLGSAVEDRSTFDCANFRRQFAIEYALRLQLQWPERRVALDEIVERVEACIEDWFHARRGGSGRALSLHVLRALQPLLALRAAYYDLHDDEHLGLAARRRGGNGPPAHRFLVEEPPFVLPLPRRAPTRAELASKWVVLKTSTDTSRAEWLSAQFGDADVRFVYLTRNPAASINGLMDGWLSDGFFSSRVDALSNPARLRIAGYTGPAEWTHSWWNFDRPEGWRAQTVGSLGEVCAFQWCATNAAALRACRNHAGRVYVMRAEELTRSRASASRSVAGLLHWLGMDPDVEDAMPDVLPVIQATVTPRPGRWKERAEELRALCARDAVRDTAHEIGYELGGLESWP